MKESGICKCCNTYHYDRKCQLSRHIKKCDPSCINYMDYIIKYEYGQIPKCIDCGEDVQLFQRKVSDRCSKCNKIYNKLVIKELAIARFSNEETKNKIIEKRIKTNIKKYGVEHASQLEETKNKTINTNMSRYGVKYTTDLESTNFLKNKALIENKEEINEKRRKSWTPEKIKTANLKRLDTVLSTYGVDSVMKIPEIREDISKKCILRYSSNEFKTKYANSIFEKHGVDNVSKLVWVRDKVKDTCKIKYGSEYYLSSKTRRDKYEELGLWTNSEDIRAFEKYRRLCIIETNKHKKELFDSWDGLCYYTNEKLITNISEYNDPLYRTIDHKISIFHGFLNDIDPLIIGNIDNLCICSRSCNSRKGVNTDNEFKI